MTGGLFLIQLTQLVLSFGSHLVNRLFYIIFNLFTSSLMNDSQLY